jgi:hypothetical protein
MKVESKGRYLPVGLSAVIVGMVTLVVPLPAPFSIDFRICQARYPPHGMSNMSSSPLSMTVGPLFVSRETSVSRICFTCFGGKPPSIRVAYALPRDIAFSFGFANISPGPGSGSVGTQGSCRCFQVPTGSMKMGRRLACADETRRARVSGFTIVSCAAGCYSV